MSDLITLLPLKLRLMREARGLTQKGLARLSKIGWRTISTFESGERIASAKIVQIEALCDACGIPFTRFVMMGRGDFGPSLLAREPHRPTKSTYQRQYRKQQKRSMSLTAAVPIIRPKRGITIFSSSDLLQSSLGEAQSR